MENLISRHRNVSILVAVLFAQVLGLAVQLKRSRNEEETRLIRIWAVELVTPFEKGLIWADQTVSGLWRNYIYLRGLRSENRELKRQIEEMRLSQVRLSEDAEQARRLQLLLGFKEKFVAQTIPAQVIGTSGSEQSRSLYIDKGLADGIKTDQPVITSDGIVGKVLHVYDRHTSSVLLINDQTSGVGVILDKSRLQGILRGTAGGELVVEKIMSDELVEAGERVLTSGGDQIFPKGFEVGTVFAVSPGKDLFLTIRVRPAAKLSKLEEVLVLTQVETKSPSISPMPGTIRAVDVLAQRLPSVPNKSAEGATSPSANPTKPTGPQIRVPQAATPAAPASRSGLNQPVMQPKTPPVNKRDLTNANSGNAPRKPDGTSPLAAGPNGQGQAPSISSPQGGMAGKPTGATTSKPNRVIGNASGSRVTPDKPKPAQKLGTAAQPDNQSAKPTPSPSQPKPAPVEDHPQ